MTNVQFNVILIKLNQYYPSKQKFGTRNLSFVLFYFRPLLFKNSLRQSSVYKDYEIVYHLPLTFERNKLIYETKVNVLHFARTLKADTIHFLHQILIQTL